MEHAVRDNAGAAELLYRRHAPRVLRYCSRYLRQRADAEDALQQTFLQVHRALARGTQPVSEIAWLLAIARNVCLTRADTLRRLNRFEVSEDPDVLADLAPAMTVEEGASPEVQAAFARLSGRQREALFLREWEACSYAEIAVRLGTTESAVETLVFRARRSLAKELAVSRRRVPGLAGLLGWLRVGLGSTASKLAAGAVAATVVAGTAITLGQHPRPPLPQARTGAASASTPAAPARVTRVERSRGRAHRRPAAAHRAADPVRQVVVPPPPDLAPASTPAAPAARPPAGSSPAPVASTPPSTKDAVSTATPVDAVTQAVGNAVPAATPVTNVVANVVDGTTQAVGTVAGEVVNNTQSAVTTVTSDIPKLLPGH